MSGEIIDADFLSVFGGAATLNGASITAVFSQSSDVYDQGVVTLAPSATVQASAAPAAAPGQAFVTLGTTYTVRQVLQLPPDGALLQLVLSRST